MRLAGFCAVVLGWAPDQFWRATPAELRCVVDVLAPREEAPVTRSLLGELEKCCG
ncbi:MAG TPA: phage tail assembly chaperone [Sphingomonas sp.]|nr:phage tail assembly chaperone [Sphingomonas sp.]HEU0043854.1 phage tail assembly chaperone [Sphingomonas sp.]